MRCVGTTVLALLPWFHGSLPELLVLIANVISLLLQKTF